MDDLHSGIYMADLLVTALRRDPTAPAVYLGDDVLTTGQLSTQVSRFAQAYAAAGVTPGSGLSVLSPNRPEVLYTTFASTLTPVRGTPLHPLGSLEDHAYVLDDAGIETLVFDPSQVERAAALKDKVPGLKRLLSLGPAEIGEDLLALAAGFEAKDLVAPKVDPEAVSGIAYTGGTTGQPKGVVGTYRSGATIMQLMLGEWQWPAELRHLLCAPLSHAAGGFVIPVLTRGGSVVVLPRFNPGEVLKTIERYRITSVFLVPSMIYALLDHPDFATTDLSSLQTVFYGASPISPVRLQEAIRKLGKIFFQFYGQAEAPQSVCVLRKEEHDPDDLARLAVCGRPVPFLHVELLDDDCQPVTRGEPGEICVRGPLVMNGYLNKPEQTAETLKGGWLHTGDVATEDAQGYYTIVDRKKDMIVSGGFNVFPREIENVLATHPAVATSAVIGVPDERWGEAVKAVVVLRPGQTADPEELMKLVKEHKGAHYAPKSVDFADAIPLTPVGKPDKKVLRARYWADATRQVG